MDFPIPYICFANELKSECIMIKFKALIDVADQNTDIKSILRGLYYIRYIPFIDQIAKASRCRLYPFGVS